MYPPLLLLRAARSLFGGAMLAIAALLCLVSCESQGSVAQYRGINTEGWERSDTLCFAIDSLPHTAHYVPHLHLRHLAASIYPYRQLTLVVEQRWVRPLPPPKPSATQMSRPSYWPELHHHRRKPHPQRDSLLLTRCDTLRLDLLSAQHHGTARGLSLLATQHQLPPIALPQGARGRITIRHIMDRESLPGLHDLGFEISPR